MRFSFFLGLGVLGACFGGCAQGPAHHLSIDIHRGNALLSNGTDRCVDSKCDSCESSAEVISQASCNRATKSDDRVLDRTAIVVDASLISEPPLSFKPSPIGPWAPERPPFEVLGQPSGQYYNEVQSGEQNEEVEAVVVDLLNRDADLSESKLSDSASKSWWGAAKVRVSPGETKMNPGAASGGQAPLPPEVIRRKISVPETGGRNDLNQAGPDATSGSRWTAPRTQNDPQSQLNSLDSAFREVHDTPVLPRQHIILRARPVQSHVVNDARPGASDQTNSGEIEGFDLPSLRSTEKALATKMALDTKDADTSHIVQDTPVTQQATHPIATSEHAGPATMIRLKATMPIGPLQKRSSVAKLHLGSPRVIRGTHLLALPGEVRQHKFDSNARPMIDHDRLQESIRRLSVRPTSDSKQR